MKARIQKPRHTLVGKYVLIKKHFTVEAGGLGTETKKARRVVSRSNLNFAKCIYFAQKMSTISQSLLF